MTLTPDWPTECAECHDRLDDVREAPYCHPCAVGHALGAVETLAAPFNTRGICSGCGGFAEHFPTCKYVDVSIWDVWGMS